MARPPDRESGGPEAPDPIVIDATSCHTGGITGHGSPGVRHVTDIAGWPALAAWLGATT